ncbi:MAG: hypothetical protein ACI8PZ_000216 [Myxococcota bacterium]|jgi:hypothetical protein
MSAVVRGLVLLSAVALVGCGGSGKGGGGDTSGTTAGSGGGGGGGASGGSGGSGGGTTGEGRPTGLQCDDPFPTPDPGGVGEGACVTEVLTCGDVVEATNTGGSTHYGTSFGEQFEQCSGSAFGDDFDGPERVFKVEVPAGIIAIRPRLESCERSWLMYFRDGAGCRNDLIDACGYAVDGTFFNQYGDILLGNARTVWLVVEGDNNDGGNFRLSIECLD